MRTLAIRHVGFEHLDLLEDILNDRGHEVRYLDAGVCPLDDIDPIADHLVIVLGGPIGVYEREAYPFLDAEVEFIARRLGARRPTLGICLGAQIMAAALGARFRGVLLAVSYRIVWDSGIRSSFDRPAAVPRTPSRTRGAPPSGAVLCFNSQRQMCYRCGSDLRSFWRLCADQAAMPDQLDDRER